MHKIIEIFADRAALHTEILALRQQVAVLKRKRPRPLLRKADTRRLVRENVSGPAKEALEPLGTENADKFARENPSHRATVAVKLREIMELIPTALKIDLHAPNRAFRLI